MVFPFFSVVCSSSYHPESFPESLLPVSLPSPSFHLLLHNSPSSSHANLSSTKLRLNAALSQALNSPLMCLIREQECCFSWHCLLCQALILCPIATWGVRGGQRGGEKLQKEGGSCWSGVLTDRVRVLVFVVHAHVRLVYAFVLVIC